MRAGDVLRDAWRLYKGHWRHLVAVALVVYAGLGLLPLLAAPLPLLVGPFVFFVFLVAFFWLMAALVQAANDIRDGYADLTIRQTLGRVWRRLNTLSAAALVAVPAIAVALGLLVVPGLLLLTWWSLAVPVIVLERAGAPRSFRRSRWLVRGHGWRVLVVVLLGALLLAMTWAGALLWALVPAEVWGDFLPSIPRLPDWLWGYALGYVILVAASSVTTPFVAVALTVLYFALKELRGPGPPVRLKLGVGGVLGEAWRVYTRHPGRLVPVAAVVFALLSLLELVVGFLGPEAAMFPVVFVVTSVGFLLLHSGVVVALPDLRGSEERIALAEVARRVGHRFFRVLGAWLLVTVFVGVSLVFLVVPGLVLLTYWSLITPVILLEGKGAFASLPRSAKLVGGNGLRVFVVLLPTVWVWSVSLGAVELAPLPPFLYLAHVMANSLLMPYLAVVWTIAYYRLRDLPDVPA